jgi:hypothetical protein
MEILSKRLDIPIEEVTKRGGDSWLVRPMGEDFAEGSAAPERSRIPKN